MTKKRNISKASAVKTSFEQAVDATPDVYGKSTKGLSALGSNSKKIVTKNSKLLDGSLDIDSSVKKLYPEDSRWDYAVSYDKKIYFVEVHPAMTCEVDTVLKKLQWLKRWLKQSAPEIEKLKAERPYHWIQTADNKIPSTTPQYRKLAETGLLPKKQCKLPVE